MSGEAILSAENSEKSLGGHGSAPNPTGQLTALPRPVVWYETVGLRTRPAWDQKIGLVLGLRGFVLCCEIQLVTLVVVILEDTTAFQVLVYFLYFVLGTSLLWRSTVAFTCLKVKCAKCAPLFTSGGLGLVILVLVLRIWSCLHHCQTP